eukprot:Plantae.Rhodophyta-Hildenbrandia_rubra.ctg4809.p1 GENE.Plantae.Rhodophyta-Hildenbrandia_rubra.ctg4809~~Plantae.Rhodophyta-Hildenbrandia_rubra.ctg4809.p1  ORF type:complete len:312 (+),score=50.39 Plantae.Rhodophyta-Hildenbrandia_rubra.ctg4809:574-1509(+)
MSSASQALLRSQAALRSQAPRGMRDATSHDITKLLEFLGKGTATIISGAGISTESGLKDYRSPGRKPRRRQIQHHEFVSNARVRTRYWARSFLGYQVFNFAQPNEAHKALAQLHSNCDGLPYHITQNVDGLLQRAGLVRENVVELHGTVHEVFCLNCGFKTTRDLFQKRCEMMNEKWSEEFRRSTGRSTMYLPDGDANLEEAFAKGFQTPACEKCEGDLMPSLVFFGGAVPRDVTLKAREIVQSARNVLVVGSSLATMSSFDLVRRSKQNGGIVAIINFGPTRADDIADLKFQVTVSDALRKLSLELVQSL